MKKMYMKPQMEAYKMKIESLICASPELLSDEAKQEAGMDSKENMFDTDDIIPWW